MAEKDLSEAEQRLLRHFEELLDKESDDVIVFDRDEAAVLKEWARFMMAWRTLGKWGASLRQVIIFFGGALAFIAALRLGLLDWLGFGGSPQ